MINFSRINKLLLNEKSRIELVNIFKRKTSPENMILQGKLWSWIKEIETLIENNKSVKLEEIEYIVKDNAPSSLDELKELLNSELQGYSKHELYQSRITPNINEFSIGSTFYQGTHVQIGISFIDEEQVKARKNKNKSLTTGFYIDHATSILMCVEGSAKIGCWSLNEKLDVNRVPNKFIGKYNEEDIQKGGLFTVKGGKQGITFISVNKCAAFFIVQIMKDKSPIRLQFDSKNHELLGVIASDQETSRFQVATVALRALSKDKHTKILLPYIEHPNAYIRWHCAREIYLRDEKEAKVIFQKLQTDVSPMIRYSAKNCLRDLYGDSKCQK
ncbi:hypothetical protein [Pseudoalteromonas sp. 68 DY56-GL68]|uniref:hypothetical protein n=1 Tax=Pseudoalteromonas sp. 68 DY56-GL68 TaxID=2974919 RepID=UPI00352BD07D